MKRIVARDRVEGWKVFNVTLSCWTIGRGIGRSEIVDVVVFELL
jgi:hypothetical protein